MIPLPQHLLDAILDDPADDGPRLIAADWWEERGEVRGEFVRVQVEFWQATVEGAALPIPGPRELTSRIATLQRRSHALLEAHGAKWLFDSVATIFPDWAYTAEMSRLGWRYTMEGRHGPTGPLRNCEFQRGFIGHIETTAAAWLAHGPAIVAREPVMFVRLLPPSENQFSRGRWCYLHPSVPAGRERSPPHVPVEFFSLMDGGRGSVPMCKWYDSEGEATADLSTATVAWARQQAGLSPLPTPSAIHFVRGPLAPGWYTDVAV